MIDLIEQYVEDNQLKAIARKVFANERLNPAEGVYLFEKGEIGFLGMLASHVCEKHNGRHVYFNKNVHIEPTNICVNKCKFCAYSREKGQHGSWEFTEEQMLDQLSKLPADITEIHIVGGIHPDRKLDFYCSLLSNVQRARPDVCIKAFTAPEIDYMITQCGLTLEEGIKKLKACGLSAVPGGGAEIFDETLRKEICPEKIPAARWLQIHELLHKHDIQTNTTMLYGHVETYAQRIDHLYRLREQQDKSKGFNAFIPLKFRNGNNAMQHVQEVSVIEDMKMFAVSRIFLDNIPHLKAYWPALGKDFAQLSLSFGVDDLDGTINDSTKIYSMAGAEEHNPSMSVEQMCKLIVQAGKIPVERDSKYNIIKKYA